jgi:hydrogenase maturation protease
LRVGSTDWKESLRSLMADESVRLHVFGIGNPLRGDDGVGLYVTGKLRKLTGPRPRPGVRIHVARANAERELSKVDPGAARVLIFDAVDAKLPPGGVLFSPLEGSKFGYFATHNVPLKLIPSIASHTENVFIAGVQPSDTEFGEGLSDVVRASADELVGLAMAALGGK